MDVEHWDFGWRLHLEVGSVNKILAFDTSYN